MHDGRIDLTHTGAVWSGPRAFDEAGVTIDDIDYASIYDSFTITVVVTLEDLGFCEKGKGGAFVADGALESPHGRLPFNTDGGGLCNNHPGNRGGMTKIIEAVRQLRGEAHPAGAGAELRAGPGARHRRIARHAFGRGHARVGAGVMSGRPFLPTDEPSRGRETKPFWEALDDERFVLPRCDNCDHVIWYPRLFCPMCHTADVSWFDASGQGTIYSFTVVASGLRAVEGSRAVRHRLRRARRRSPRAHERRELRSRDRSRSAIESRSCSSDHPRAPPSTGSRRLQA